MILSPDSPFSPVDAARVVLEMPNCVALLDNYPVAEGHTLVVPKLTVGSLYDLPEAVQAEIWDTVSRVRAIQVERFHPDGFNIGVNDGPAAGQTISHAHVHVIPRYVGDVPDPRGGIRWVIPQRARYWRKDG
jgi:diadenosine tetraphosphate (Ap4A) HIT family hydrolase